MPRLTRKQISIVIALVVILTLLGSLTYERLSPNGLFSNLQNDLKEIQPDDTLVYTDLDGNTVDLKSFKGKPLIINSWATWMPFSKNELLLLEKIKETYHDKVTVLAVNRKEPVAVVRSFIETFSITGGVIFLNDPTDHFYKTIGGYAMPETVFYRDDGTIHHHMRGVLTESDLNNFIQALLPQ